MHAIIRLVLHHPQDVMIRRADVSGIAPGIQNHAADRWVSEMLCQYTAGSFHGRDSAKTITVSVAVAAQVSECAVIRL